MFSRSKAIYSHPRKKKSKNIKTPFRFNAYVSYIIIAAAITAAMPPTTTPRTPTLAALPVYTGTDA